MAGGGRVVPEDIVFEILMRMPTNPLLVLRCLSKHWNHLISEYFTNSRSRRMILLPSEPLHAINHPLPPWARLHSIKPLPLWKQRGTTVIIVGTFKGIVLLVLRDMILYNPLTGAFKILPDPRSDSFGRSNYFYGFGYDEADDLQIVRLGPNNSPDRWCEVFSLKKGSWTTISKTTIRFSRCYIRSHSGTFLNGFLYWIAFCPEHKYCFILAFDVKEMLFSEIEVSYYVSSTNCVLSTLSGGRLCLFNEFLYEFELWVMNDQKSWSKVLTSKALSDNVYTPLCIIEPGKIVFINKFKNQKEVTIYDMLKESYNRYTIEGSIRGLFGLQAIEYVESLISPSDLCSDW